MSTKQEDFIRKSVLAGCIEAGIPEQPAQDQAETAVLMYRRNQLGGKPLDLIKPQIQTAKRINKKKKGMK